MVHLAISVQQPKLAGIVLTPSSRCNLQGINIKKFESVLVKSWELEY